MLCRLFILAILSTATFSFSQSDSLTTTAKDSAETIRAKKDIDFTISILALAGRGDLSASYDKWNGGISFGLLFNNHKRLYSSWHIMTGIVSQQSREYYSTSQNVFPVGYVRTRLIGGNYTLFLNLIKRSKYRIYVGQGFGLMGYKPLDEYGKKLRDESATRNRGEEYGNVAVMWPTTLGFSVRFYNVYLGYNATFYHIQTDYLDNMSELGSFEGNDRVLAQSIFITLPLRNNFYE